jgi:hypothetical protein
MLLRTEWERQRAGPSGNVAKYFDKKRTFGGLYAFGECLGSVTVRDANSALGYDRTRIVFAFNKMHRHAGFTITGCQNRAVDMHSVHTGTAKFWQKCGMSV